MWIQNVKSYCHSVLSNMKEKEVQVHSPSNLELKLGPKGLSAATLNS